MKRLCLLLCLLMLSPAWAAPRVLKNLSYVSGGDARQKLDLYLPAGNAKAPLLIFVHGGFWGEGDEKYGIGKEIAETLVKDGVAVALLRYRLSVTHPHPAQIEDVAAGFAYLVRNTGKHSYDARRIYLAGHSAGGHLVGLLALDEQYLTRHKLKPAAISGVIGLSGVYSLDTEATAPFHKAAVELAFGADAAARASAAPQAHAQNKAPPFLLINPDKDLPRLQLQARQFADALAAAGTEVDYMVIPKLDHLSVARPTTPGNPLEQFILWRMGVRPLSERLELLRTARREWLNPPLSTAGFWERYPALIESRPVDKRFLQALFYIYQDSRGELRGWPLKQYHRIELFRLLDALPGNEGGDYISLRNLKNEVQVWHRSEIEAHKPVIVVGLDDEKNLFRLQRFYQMQREYSWRDTPVPPMMVLPVGGFVYFEEAPPPALRAQLWHYGIMVDGISRSARDPLEIVRGHSPELVKVLRADNGCVYCHALGNISSRSHHVTARGAQPHGGFALGLGAYPPAVVDRFLDHQKEAAMFMGATPNEVDPAAREALRNLIKQERDGKN